jgi:hypothetical protein
MHTVTDLIEKTNCALGTGEAFLGGREVDDMFPSGREGSGILDRQKQAHI